MENGSQNSWKSPGNTATQVLRTLYMTHVKEASIYKLPTYLGRGRTALTFVAPPQFPDVHRQRSYLFLLRKDSPLFLTSPFPTRLIYIIALILVNGLLDILLTYLTLEIIPKSRISPFH